MSERRNLIAGLKPSSPPIDPALEKQFVFGDKAPWEAEAVVEKPSPTMARAPITTRIRADFAVALKRASLERQLSGTTPNTLQEILKKALEPWLKSHGYVA